MCSPANSTGVVAHRDRVKALAELHRPRGIWLISDEIYSTYDDAFVTPACFAQNVLICSSFSKTHAMPGWQLGYVMAHKLSYRP
ncbi:MAG: aminotransferase class I/II-fold pyridoxal phosphate-dependent enzyme [Gemmatales bacterium]